MKRSLALCIVFGALSAGPALSGEIREHTTYFMVSGKSFDELNRQLGMKGPDIGGGDRHAGSTEVSFKSDTSYKAVPGGCRIGQARVKLDLRTTLPRWSAPSNSTRETRVLWKTLRDDIATHEAEHAHIAKSWLKRIEDKIRSLPAEANCSLMESRANAEIRAMIKHHDADQLAFDAAEAKRIDARLKRKLDESMSRLAAR
ncbi:DUF922 domain-containing Zn-dependent protease [Aureimonas sp. AU40]|uniref:DUF922 domain-containing Zn-dependent protease n=1 Tax=Aureimonas sp. AU40 TaxID=1637747 RepID=UPI0009E96127|nr:DUF922 domain-containing protein [Aureimonas sp. AU40]